MATTNGNKKILDLKRWEMVTPAPTTAGSGACIASSRHFRQQQLYLASNTVAYIYLPEEDGWIQIPSPALAGTFGSGATAVSSAWSTGSTVGAASLTATAGTTSTITTNQTLARDLRGYSVHILSGPNAGATIPILRNTIGANAIITVATQGVSFSASTVYRLLTPRWYVLGAGTLAAGSFRTYDFATNTWTTLSITSFATAVGTDSKLVTTPSFIGTEYKSFATGTATSATGTTLVNSAKTWTTSQWVNFQIRIVSGTGAGQIRTITANDGTSLTVAAWTVTPDATSVYSIEGNDDYIYYTGNGGTSVYRYSITANTWSTLATRTASSTGMSAHWIHSVSDSQWTSESAILNGRRIYSFRGGSGAILDYYDIPSNTWTSGITYAPAIETFTTGTKYAYVGDNLYIHKDATGRWFRYNFVTNSMDGWNTCLYPNSTAQVGDTAFDVSYIDGNTEITYIYMLLNTQTVMLRQMII
jgi:hypothetical protein